MNAVKRNKICMVMGSEDGDEDTVKRSHKYGGTRRLFNFI